MRQQKPMHCAATILVRQPSAATAMTEFAFQRVLRQRAIALRCRAAELADSLQRFRERKAQIDAGTFESLIYIPPVAAGWLTDSLAA